MFTCVFGRCVPSTVSLVPKPFGGCCRTASVNGFAEIKVSLHWCNQEAPESGKIDRTDRLAGRASCLRVCLNALLLP